MRYVNRVIYRFNTWRYQGRTSPTTREVVGTIVCWLVGHEYDGQFCTRCGDFWP